MSIKDLQQRKYSFEFREMIEALYRKINKNNIGKDQANLVIDKAYDILVSQMECIEYLNSQIKMVIRDAELYIENEKKGKIITAFLVFKYPGCNIPIKRALWLVGKRK